MQDHEDLILPFQSESNTGYGQSHFSNKAQMDKKLDHDGTDWVTTIKLVAGANDTEEDLESEVIRFVSACVLKLFSSGGEVAESSRQASDEIWLGVKWPLLGYSPIRRTFSYDFHQQKPAIYVMMPEASNFCRVSGPLTTMKTMTWRFHD